MQEMTPDQIFCELCKYHGIRTLGPMLIKALHSLRQGEMEQS